MNSRKTGWLALALAAAAGIGTVSAGDPATPGAEQGKGTTAQVAKAAEPAAKPPDAGDVAPAFSLPGSDGSTYTLADFKGRKAVVVAWFPKAFTGG
jgi:cytochrome oxidase Cu insertion factor (SCO1/SenC/PrrC family)